VTGLSPQVLDWVRSQVAAYKRFRKLMDDWVHLAIEQTQIKLELSRNAALK